METQFENPILIEIGFESKMFAINFPELNLASVRLERLENQVESRTLLTTFKLLAKLFEVSRKHNLLLF
jgi:hypothetical protein